MSAKPASGFVRQALWFAVGVSTGIAVMQYRESRRPVEIRQAEVAMTQPTLSVVSARDPLALAQPSFEARLNAVQATDPKDLEAKRAAVMLDWLAHDRAGAMRYLIRTSFRDIDRMPGLSRAIGEKATVEDLLAIANGSKYPGQDVGVVGQFASPAVINEFAGMVGSLNPEIAGPVTLAVGEMLAGINLDRAISFALGQTTDALRASAMAGVFDVLSQAPNGEAQVRLLYGTLPPGVQASDQVAAAYGNAIWPTDPAAALQALGAIENPQTKMLACLALARNTSSSSPETAIAAIYESGMPSVGIYNHVNTILQNWYSVDPQAAGTFLSTTQVIPPSDKSSYDSIVSPPPTGGKG